MVRSVVHNAVFARQGIVDDDFDGPIESELAEEFVESDPVEFPIAVLGLMDEVIEVVVLGVVSERSRPGDLGEGVLAWSQHPRGEKDNPVAVGFVTKGGAIGG